MAATLLAVLLMIDIPGSGVVELPAGETHLARPLEIPKGSRHVTMRGNPAGSVLVLDTDHPLDAMPDGSVFPSIRAAYDYLVDFYDAFAYDTDADDVLVLQIERGDWDIRVVEPVDYYLGYVSDGPFSVGAAELDSVFHFTDVSYRWLPLLKERVAHRPT